MWGFGNYADANPDDYSVKANELTGTNISSADYVAGVRGWALDFDGSTEYVSCTDASCGGASDLDLGTSYTIGAWLYPDTLGDTSRYILFKHDNASTGYLLRNDVTTSKLTFRENLSTDLTSATALTTGQWQYVTITYDGSSARIYINGIQNAQSSSFVGPTANAISFYLGGDGDTLPDFDGRIDEAFFTAQTPTPSPT